VRGRGEAGRALGIVRAKLAAYVLWKVRSQKAVKNRIATIETPAPLPMH
jgi:hypothetical protein